MADLPLLSPSLTTVAISKDRNKYEKISGRQGKVKAARADG
jgi:hypothetical protein